MKKQKLEKAQDHFILPKWVRLTAEGEQVIHQEYIAAYDGRACREWPWFCQIVDYHEGCARTSLRQNWKTRAIRALLFLVEKIASIECR